MRSRGSIVLLAVAPVAAIALVGSSSASAATSCPDWDLQPTAQTMKRVAASIVCLINDQRRAAGLATLREDPRLDTSSTNHARDMVGYHYLAHARKDGPPLVTRIRVTGYFDHVVGGLYTENVGVAPDANATAAAIVDAWMQSDDHRVNILRPEFRDIGVGGILTGPDPAFYEDWSSVVYATDFGRRYYSSPAPVCLDARSTDPGAPRTVCSRRAHRRKHRHRRVAR